LGLWGAVGASGATFGVLAGGLLTRYVGWEYIFFLNVPIGVVALALMRRVVPESRLEAMRRRFDPFGAVSVTAGLLLLVYAISKAPDVGWGSARTILLLIAAALMLALFVVIELRGRAPLMPFSIFRIRSLSAANVVGFLMGMVIFATFFLLTLYVQQVLGWSALQTGITFLATAGTTVIFAGFSQALTTRFGTRPIMTAGLIILAMALYWYTRIPVHGHYWPDLLPAYLVFALGMALTFIPVSIAAFAGVDPRQAGLASGLLNTSQQIGGAIGVAVATTIFTTQGKSLLKTGNTPAQAFTSGYQQAFWALVALALAGATAAFLLLRGVRPAQEQAEGQPAGAAI
ncbi:MAG TPA: MFS transporter, partial [Gaiellaceae bacterium]